MPYTIDRFRRLGLYEEKVEGEAADLGGGKVITKLPDEIKRLLRTVSPEGVDKSRKDLPIIMKLLKAGLSTQDVYATFVASPRGQDASGRKADFEDYMRRTIEKGVGFVAENTKKDEPLISRGDTVVRQRGQIIEIGDQEEEEILEEDELEDSIGGSIPVEKIVWLWKNWLPLACVSIITGDPGIGKSTLVYDWVSRIGRGAEMPDKGKSLRGVCSLASTEEDTRKAMRPRLIAAGADDTKYRILGESTKTNPKGVLSLSLPRDEDKLRRYLIKYSIRLLVIDPIDSFLDPEIDTNKKQDMRRVLDGLGRVAQESGTTILIMVHKNKRTDVSGMNRVSGSHSIVAAARAVIEAERLENGTTQIKVIKSNYGVFPEPIPYKIISDRKERDGKKTNWIGEVDSFESSKVRYLDKIEMEELTEDDRGTAFLRQFLSGGERSRDEILAESRTRSPKITRREILVAEENLKVIERRSGGKVYLRLPTNTD